MPHPRNTEFESHGDRRLLRLGLVDRESGAGRSEARSGAARFGMSWMTRKSEHCGQSTMIKDQPAAA
jgi:hypothetical protein